MKYTRIKFNYTILGQRGIIKELLSDVTVIVSPRDPTGRGLIYPDETVMKMPQDDNTNVKAFGVLYRLTRYLYYIRLLKILD